MGQLGFSPPIQPPKKASGKKNDGSCWVATAYYGDPYSPAVDRLRDYRGHMLSSAIFGPLMSAANNLYLAIGRTQFGRWWARNAGPARQGSWQRRVSQFAIRAIEKHYELLRR